MWKPSYYQWLLDFLDEDDNRKLFFWVEGEDIMISNSNPPKYYGKLTFQTILAPFSNSNYGGIFVQIYSSSVNLILI